MEVNLPHLTTQKTLYVEISGSRDHAELLTDDRVALHERLEAATGEYISALEAVEPERELAAEADPERTLDQKPKREKVIEGPGLELELQSSFGCCPASSFDHSESTEIKALSHRSASNLRAEQQVGRISPVYCQ